MSDKITDEIADAVWAGAQTHQSAPLSKKDCVAIAAAVYPLIEKQVREECAEVLSEWAWIGDYGPGASIAIGEAVGLLRAMARPLEPSEDDKQETKL